MSIRLSELKALHAQGLALIYLHSAQKRPLENEWTTGTRKKWDELENSFEKSYNVGVRLGEPSLIKGKGYLACIDVDIKDPRFKKRALSKLAEITGDAVYPEVRSGGGNGSRHLYCYTEKPFQQMTFAKHKHQWEIVAYSTGRQMVLPPSIHPDTGFKYAWHVPFTVKGLPLFKPEKHRSVIGQSQVLKPTTAGDFIAVDVDLWKTNLPVTFIHQIENGDGCDDRSATLLTVTMSMCRHGFTDNQILSVLSNPKNWIAAAAYEHTQSRDRAKAVRWLDRYTLQKARYETHIMRRFENPPEMVKLTKKEQATVKEKVVAEIDTVLPDLDGKGKPLTTVRNVVHVLEKFFGGGLIGHDDFSNRYVFLKDTLYGGVKGKELNDNSDLNLQQYLATHYRFEPSTDTCLKAHTYVGQRHHYHPVTGYLDALEWDGVPRLDHWLTDGFGATGPKEYLQAVGRKTLVAAVARVYEPGCKFDYVTVLEGPQGKGKSMALGGLAGQKWFTDSLGDIHNKDAVDQMTGKWVIELSELSAISGAEITYVKGFLSRQVDRVRPPYGRRSEDFPRQSIFIGSTNDTDYLKDASGNRRYWPVAITRIKRKWLKANRDQLWAEAKVRYELGENVWLCKKLEAVAKLEQEKRFDVDEWEIEIRKALKRGGGDGTYTGTELWRAIHIDNGFGFPTPAESKRIGRIMRRLEFVTKVRRRDGVNTKCWARRDL